MRERAENMLPSSLKTPASSALLSSEVLNVVTPAAHSVGAQESECESGAENESESYGEDDDDSDDDLEIVGEESGTANKWCSRAFFVTEYQRWEALALGPENGHRGIYPKIAPKVSPIAVNNIIVKKLSPKVSPIAVNVIDYHFHLLQ